jgi:hypothetical protein
VNEQTVCLRKKNLVSMAIRIAEPVGFEIEVPPGLARELGLSVMTPLQSRVIRCARVARPQAR